MKNKGDIQNVKFGTNNVDLIYSQRFIHYLPYSQAQELAKKLYTIADEGCRLYISASGMNTELSEGYNNKDIHNRHAKLIETVAEKHGIISPVTLYRKEELEELFNNVGFTTLKSWESAFGNIKSIFEK